MRILFLLLVVTVIVAVVIAKFRSKTVSTALDEEHDGSTFEEAIVISSTDESAGVRDEYKWLAKHYPNYQMENQTLLEHNGKAYDLLRFKTAEGQVREVYFDISAFFGK